jgi:hypothetical protein
MNIVLDLKWFLLLWHALAKLRLHIEPTISILEKVGSDLGKSARLFAKECESIETYELPSEVGARLRRDARTKARREEGLTKHQDQGATDKSTGKGKAKTLSASASKKAKVNKGKEIARESCSGRPRLFNLTENVLTLSASREREREEKSTG